MTATTAPPRLFLALTAVVTAMAFLTAPAVQAAAEIGKPISFTAQTLSGQTINTANLKGRMVVVEFWATWCPPCVKLTPKLKAMHDKYAPEGVILLGVSLDRSESKVTQYTKKNHMTWPQILNKRQPVDLGRAMFGGSYGIPRAVIIGPEGKVRWIGNAFGIESQLGALLTQHPMKLDESTRNQLVQEQLLRVG
ncbi:MAG: TlpA disulfide reductase family protein, partial [Phycisphaeraceae bacterium]|nr:TlpA disulfide reductase family protein [Phycisphaeraceae bacterium]